MQEWVVWAACQPLPNLVDSKFGQHFPLHLGLGKLPFWVSSFGNFPIRQGWAALLWGVHRSPLAGVVVQPADGRLAAGRVTLRAGGNCCNFLFVYQAQLQTKYVLTQGVVRNIPDSAYSHIGGGAGTCPSQLRGGQLNTPLSTCKVASCSHPHALVAFWVGFDGAECILPPVVSRVLSLVLSPSSHPSTPLGGILPPSLTATPLSHNPPCKEEPQNYQSINKPAKPQVFLPLASAFLLCYLGVYFFLGQFNPLLGQYYLFGEIFHLGMVPLPVGSLVTGINPSAIIHHLGRLLPIGGCLTEAKREAQIWPKEYD
ncbi:hypothetical protein DSO57_1016485 [Entomophthora muscae]|uniref:Uncharacterized protein n=1 Tax=Entomophthora muscae TaxID=34485 RepID=A0ACC2TFF4_9FUNG|nr:hypothetical protein DSO57_1016485 [Entomophthora muscae]